MRDTPPGRAGGADIKSPQAAMQAADVDPVGDSVTIEIDHRRC